MGRAARSTDAVRCYRAGGNGNTSAGLVPRNAGKPAHHAPRSDQPLTELDKPENVARATTWLRESAPEAVQGAGGDDTTFRVACRLRDFALSQETALDLLLEHWNEDKASRPGRRTISRPRSATHSPIVARQW